MTNSAKLNIKRVVAKQNSVKPKFNNYNSYGIKKVNYKANTNKLPDNNDSESIDFKIENSDFSKLTDFQNVSLTAIDFIQYLAINGFDINRLKGKTISECVEIFSEGNDEYHVGFLKGLMDNGFSDYKIVEVIQDGSFDAVVLQDPSGNYRIFYNSTKNYGDYSDDIGDYLYDARNIVEEQFVNGWIDSLLGNAFETTGTFAGTALGIAASILGAPQLMAAGVVTGKVLGANLYKKAVDAIRNGLDPDSDSYLIEFIENKLDDSGMDESMKKQLIYTIKNGGLNGQYQDQQNKAKALADKYFNTALSKGKKLSVQGYSLGGSLTEAAYLSLCDREGANEVLDGVVLYNPYHDNLTTEEANKIKNANGFELYCAEGDMVSTVFNYDDFKDDAKYLYMDYKTLLKKNIGNIENDGFKMDQLSNFSAIFGNTHLPHPYLNERFEGTSSQIAFAEDGSVRKNVNGYDVHGHSFEELSQYLFGGDKIANVDELGKAIVSEGASTYLGINLTDGDLENPTNVIPAAGTKALTAKIAKTALELYLNSNDSGGSSHGGGDF